MFDLDAPIALLSDPGQEHQIITLSARDSVQFIEALLNPPEPNARLRAAWRDYKESLDE